MSNKSNKKLSNELNKLTELQKENQLIKHKNKQIIRYVGNCFSSYNITFSSLTFVQGYKNAIIITIDKSRHAKKQSK